jgi:ribonuclease P protein component
VYDRGTRISNPLFAAFCLARPAAGGGPRLGITTPRALGGAVARNRIKRRLREAFRLHQAGLDARWDVVLNPRRAAIDAPFGDLERALRQVIERCNSRS